MIKIWRISLSAFFVGLFSFTPKVSRAQVLNENEIQRIATQITVSIVTPNPRNPQQMEPTGSGVIIANEDNTYYVLTVKHVANSGNEYQVITADGVFHQVEGTGVRELADLDLGWLTFKSSTLYQSANLGNSESLKDGDRLYLYGWPLFSNSAKLASGNFRRHLTTHSEGYAITYDANTENGMSGGPILNARGSVVGIHGRQEKLYKSGIPIERFLNHAASGLTWLQICNKYEPDSVNLAFAKLAELNRFLVRGWYNIYPNSCRGIYLGEEYRGRIYFYARSPNSGKFWGKGDLSLCLNLYNNFIETMEAISTCSDRNRSQVGLRERRVSPGENRVDLVE
ncbi:trypsin-like peptidase domain-containing protein [Laspinema olomoucense]|uniref:trypsin-like peptidase domain-containing protein n=1 Tax=Laspinema olomoucense TaxID=3231600 RepID=UPI0021BB661A|nr:trypsin-like peptidase domain-containing protein [Laspinema sp. D3c]MCT7997549.1 trypsin-like peptidase domain-containing protein [Laspinema sp. D3c]